MRDYISIGGRKYRVESNWNAIADFCRKKGASGMESLSVLSEIGIPDMLPLMHSCIKEGERLDGRGFGLSEEDLGSLVSAETMGEFMRVYAEQVSPGSTSGSGEGDVKKAAEPVGIREFMGIAVGEMDMGVAEFWEMRLAWFFLKLRYFTEMKRREMVQHADLVRLQTLTLVNIQLRRQDRISDPKRLWQFPWETDSGESKGRVLDMDNIKKLSKLL